MTCGPAKAGRLSLASRVSATIFRAFALMAFHLAAAESNTS